MIRTDTYNGRLNVDSLLSNSLKDLFNKNEVDLIPFGFEKLFAEKEDSDYQTKCLYDNLKSFIDSETANLSHSSMLVKFLPDFILLKKTNPQAVYFLEAKASVTPLYSTTRVEEIRKFHKKNVKLSDIGIIAREAWNAYKNLFPNTIIVSACTYNPHVLKAQFVEKITCLRCNGQDGMKNCLNCPVKSRSFFENSRNYNSSGSKTQHTNLDLSSFLPFKEFFSLLDINVNEQKVNELIETFKTQKIYISPQN